MNTRLIPAAVLIAAAVLVLPSRASAQSAASTQPASAALQQSNVPAPVQNAAEDVEDVVERFRVGVRGGVGLDPELIDFGAHATFGPIFRNNISFRPGIEFGLGEVTTMFGVNLDVLYRLPGATGTTRWAPYVGAGPNFSLSHRGFETEETDHVDVNGDGVTDTNGDRPNRFDFSDTDFKSGVNFIVGARSRSGAFFELNATAYGVSNIRLLAGFNF